MKTFSRGLLVCVLLMSLMAPKAQAEADMREFVMSCTYGVLAGTLVGAAMLAFTDQPGDNLNKVARGASLGLYTGIILGFYVVYGVSNDDDPTLMNGPAEGWRSKERKNLWAMVPTLSDKGRPDGAALFSEIVRF